MNAKMDRYLIVESPDTTATVDFLDCPEHVGVQIIAKIEDGKLSLEVRAPMGGEAYRWDKHELTVELPCKEPPRECACRTCTRTVVRGGDLCSECDTADCDLDGSTDCKVPPDTTTLAPNAWNDLPCGGRVRTDEAGVPVEVSDNGHDMVTWERITVNLLALGWKIRMRTEWIDGDADDAVANIQAVKISSLAGSLAPSSWCILRGGGHVLTDEHGAPILASNDGDDWSELGWDLEDSIVSDLAALGWAAKLGEWSGPTLDDDATAPITATRIQGEK